MEFKCLGKSQHSSNPLASVRIASEYCLHFKNKLDPSQTLGQTQCSFIMLLAAPLIKVMNMKNY